jgi:ribosome-associated protein
MTTEAGLFVRPGLVVPERELTVRGVRSSGPGGQNVNRVATKVELSFDLPGSTVLDARQKARLTRLAGSRLASDGSVLITSQLTRSRVQNLADAREKLAELIRAALVTPKRRRATKPTRASRERRLKDKRHASDKKQSRTRRED